MSATGEASLKPFDPLLLQLSGWHALETRGTSVERRGRDFVFDVRYHALHERSKDLPPIFQRKGECLTWEAIREAPRS